LIKVYLIGSQLGVIKQERKLALMLQCNMHARRGEHGERSPPWNVFLPPWKNKFGGSSKNIVQKILVSVREIFTLVSQADYGPGNLSF